MLRFLGLAPARKRRRADSIEGDGVAVSGAVDGPPANQPVAGSTGDDAAVGPSAVIAPPADRPLVEASRAGAGASASGAVRTPGEEEEDAARPFNLLPDELVQRIMQQLGAEDAFKSGLPSVSKRMRRLLHCVPWSSLTINVELFGRHKRHPQVVQAAGTPQCNYDNPEHCCRWSPVLRSWTDHILLERIRASISRVEVLIQLPNNDEFEARDDEPEHNRCRWAEYARAFAHLVPELGGLLAAAAQCLSLSSVSVSLYGNTDIEYTERPIVFDKPAVTIEHLLTDVVVALLPCKSLRGLEVHTNARLYQMPLGQLPPERLAGLVAPHAASLRTLVLPSACALGADQVQALVSSLPALTALDLSVLRDEAAASLRRIARLEGLARLHLGSTPDASQADLAAGLADLAAGPATRSLRALFLGRTRAQSPDALEAIGKIGGLDVVTVPVDGSSVEGVQHLAALTKVRELRLCIRLAGNSREGLAELCRALAALVTGLLARGQLNCVCLFLEATSGHPTPAFYLFEPDAFAELVAACRPVLNVVVYEVCVDRPPSKGELEALMSCPRLCKLEFRHVVRHIADLQPYSIVMPRPGLEASVEVKVEGPDATHGERLGARCLYLLYSWLPSSWDVFWASVGA